VAAGCSSSPVGGAGGLTAIRDRKLVGKDDAGDDGSTSARRRFLRRDEDDDEAPIR